MKHYISIYQDLSASANFCVKERPSMIRLVPYEPNIHHAFSVINVVRVSMEVHRLIYGSRNEQRIVATSRKDVSQIQLQQSRTVKQQRFPKRKEKKRWWGKANVSEQLETVCRSFNWGNTTFSTETYCCYTMKKGLLSRFNMIGLLL